MLYSYGDHRLKGTVMVVSIQRWWYLLGSTLTGYAAYALANHLPVGSLGFYLTALVMGASGLAILQQFRATLSLLWTKILLVSWGCYLIANALAAFILPVWLH